ncbi:MAG: DegT/DnrJ/EryC1/StrS family aminotransferase [bacterium]|nr:DegT/DnrJ/EryC1/StrS family aminotransferase [bacterium]
MLMNQIPLAQPDITQHEIDAVVQVLRTPNLSLGPQLERFEQAFADYCGTRFGVACNSGTSALHLLMIALGIEPGDEVIVTPFSFIASANCVLFEGGTPVFADVDPHTWNLDPQQIKTKVTPRTKAIIPVDVFGQVADLDPVLELARKHRIAVLEDSCEAVGATYQGRRAGGIGDAGVFGFYPNKQLTAGEGGMIVTDHEEWAALARSVRNQGRNPGGGWLGHDRLGYNFRLSDLNCALGLAQLDRVDEILESRRRVAEMYLQRLGEDPRLIRQKPLEDTTMSWFVFVVRLIDEYTQDDRDRILTQLRAQGIGSSNYFAPIHLQPFYVERFGFKPGDFPVCEALAARTLALPFHAHLTEAEIDFVCTSLKNLL